MAMSVTVGIAKKHKYFKKQYLLAMDTIFGIKQEMKKIGNQHKQTTW
jgi:hypothetical protein